MKRSRIGVDAIASWDTLCAAFHLSARGKAGRRDVEAFRRDLEQNLAELIVELHSGQYRPRAMRRFAIRDPKPRVIHAPHFRDRVVHHALMAHVAPVLDRALSPTSFACRPGMGVLAAVEHAKRQCRHGLWHVQVDVAQYFPTICHRVLLAQLARKFSDHDILALFEIIVAAHEERGRTGLPIGALTSQWFANFYLSSVDRFLEADPRVVGHVRYMDDVVWWCRTREDARNVHLRVIEQMLDLRLSLKPGTRCLPSGGGLVFCGYRVAPGALLLSRKQRRRFCNQIADINRALADGFLTEVSAQRRMDAILSTVGHARAAVWRRDALNTNDLAMVG